MANPYEGLPDYQFWRRSVAEPAPAAVDPVVSVPFRLSKAERIVTAGSCFAQHVARHLKQHGFNHHVTEAGHPFVASVAAQNGYGLFSARYGNVYTARQLLQLWQRAYGQFRPGEPAWKRPDGTFADPFRPQIQRIGFHSIAELEADRQAHLALVRRAFEEMEVFIFTLGLTEAWTATADGAVFPVAPGAVAGAFDPARHGFVNFGVENVVQDLANFLLLARAKNPHFKLILTVSPVPLVATAEDRHVLVSTTYSKSVLRVAADYIVRDFANAAYFPAYEIVTGAFTRGRYFASDLRSVTEEGVGHVMSVFLRHFSDGAAAPAPAPPQAPPAVIDAEDLVRVQCEEEALDPARRA